MKRFVLAIMAAAAIGTQAVAQNKVKNVYASASQLQVEQFQNVDQTVQLNRYLFAGYNTICLPMSLDAQQLAAAAQGVQVERLVAVGQEGSTLNLYFIDCTNEGIEAGKPYLIYSPTAQYLRAKNTDAVMVNTAIETIRMTDGEGNQVSFGSSWASKAKAGLYGIPAQQPTTPLQSILVRTEGDKTFLPTRCGFSWEQQSATATELKIRHITSMSELNPTGIRSQSVADGTVDVYGINGKVVKRQASGTDVKSLKKGVYVVGGEKRLIP